MSDIQPNKDHEILIPAEDVTVSEPKPDPHSRIKAAIKKPGTYLSGALQSIRGRDIETLVEEFSSDVTLVLGGLSDDQERLGHENEQLRQQITALEKRVRDLEKKSSAQPPKEKDNLIRRLTWLAAVVFGGMALLYIIKFLLS